MNAVLGQYAELDTFFHKLHPLTKLMGLFVLILITLLYSNIYFYLAQIALLCLVLLLAKLPLKIIAKGLWSVRHLFIFLFIFNVIFLRDGEPIWQWGIFALYPKTLLVTVNLIMRLLLLTSYATILTLSTKPLDLTTAIEEKLSFLGDFAHVLGMILSLALRFIPTLQDEAYKIMKAQTSRGADFAGGSIMKRAKHIISLLIPLFVISFNRADTLAVAMELRGYDPNEKRTKFRNLSWQRVDAIISIIMVGYAVFAIAMKIIYF